jgi:hypothetical protein
LRGCRHKHARHPRCQVRDPSCRRRPQHLSLTRLVSPRHHRPLGPRRHPLGNSSPSSGDGRSRCPPSTRSRTCASSKSCAEEQGYHAGLRSLPASAPPRLCWPRPPPCRISTRTIEGMAAMNTHTHVMAAAIEDAFRGRLINISVCGHRVPLAVAFWELFFIVEAWGARREWHPRQARRDDYGGGGGDSIDQKRGEREDDRGLVVMTIRTAVQFHGVTPA